MTTAAAAADDDADDAGDDDEDDEEDDEDEPATKEPATKDKEDDESSSEDDDEDELEFQTSKALELEAELKKKTARLEEKQALLNKEKERTARLSLLMSQKNTDLPNAYRLKIDAFVNKEAYTYMKVISPRNLQSGSLLMNQFLASTRISGADFQLYYSKILQRITKRFTDRRNADVSHLRTAFAGMSFKLKTCLLLHPDSNPFIYFEQFSWTRKSRVSPPCCHRLHAVPPLLLAVAAFVARRPAVTPFVVVVVVVAVAVVG